MAYGSTLLAVVLADEFLICFQLGDGDVLAVSDATGVAERVIPKDETLIANETTSLCQEDGLRYVRYRFQLLQRLPAGNVALIYGRLRQFVCLPRRLSQGWWPIISTCFAQTGPRRSPRICRAG